MTNAPTIGDLIHRFGLEAPIRTDDGAGGAMVSFALVSEVWGSLTATGGGERAGADRLAATHSHVIAIRHRAGLTPAHRFALGSRRFAIQAIIDHDGRSRFLECRCSEVIT